MCRPALQLTYSGSIRHQEAVVEGHSAELAVQWANIREHPYLAAQSQWKSG